MEALLMLYSMFKEICEYIMDHAFTKGCVIGLLIVTIIFCAFAPLLLCFSDYGIRMILWYFVTIPVGVGCGFVIDDISYW